ncbi:MAG: hypothetical protein K0R82_977, partial [Flavipsychrobacter sp.]|nr:hypothetical protein [Flavipsychrobacter sp.]
MNRLTVVKLCSLACLLCLTLFARGQTPITINGPAKVCMNSNSAYAVPTPTTGLVYQWTLNTGGLITGSSTANNISISWGSTAVTCTLSVNGIPAGGGAPVETGQLIIDVVSRPQPVIFTNYRVACQNFAFDSTGNGTGRVHTDPPVGPPPTDPDSLFDDKKGCVKVCENAMVTYTASTIPTGHTVSWAVSGGTIITGQGTGTLVVQWGTAGPGSITLYEANGDCVGEKTVCVTIITKPTALFAILPSTTPPTGTTTVCLRTAVSFLNLSTPNTTTSPIVSYYWDFGDGTSSGQKVPSPHTYAAAGTYTVTLTVKNACNCVDVYQAQIEVLNTPGPRILCPSVVCENTVVEYRTPAACSGYSWSVIGGTIQGASTGNSINVLWDNVGPDGFGYVSLTVSGCPNLCVEPTVIKVPVVQANPVVTGPTIVCENKQVEFSVPLWPGMQYNWGVINTPTPSPIYGTRNDHKVALQFSTPGTYTVHLAFQNRIALCGGDLQFNVTVVPQDNIVGDLTACKSSTAVVYSMANSNSANWELLSPTSILYTGTGTSYNAVFNEVGYWKLTATGTVCPQTIGINVTEMAIPVDDVKGKTQVCINQVTPYTASNALPGTIFTWEITTGAGTLSAPTGNSVGVTWSALPATLVVRRQSTTPPYCEGPDYVLNITQDMINPNVTGPDDVCANTYTNFSGNYNNDGASFTWSVAAQTAGSVTSGNYDPDMVFLANHFTVITPATLTVTVKQCGMTVTASKNITIHPSIPPVISGPTSVCSGNLAMFTASTGAGTYAWTFGDGATYSNAANGAQHTYWNSTGAPIVYDVEVFASGTDGTLACPPSGFSTKHQITVLSGPPVGLTYVGPTTYCIPATVNTVLTANVPAGGSYSYQWYNLGGAITGATSSSYTATAGGGYSVEVTDNVTGCKSRTGILPIDVIDCNTTCPLTVTTQLTNNCGIVTATELTSTAGSYDPEWGNISNLDGQYTTSRLSTTATIQYVHAGTFQVNYTKKLPTGPGTFCSKTFFDQVDVPLVPGFVFDVDCGLGAYTYTLHDAS